MSTLGNCTVYPTYSLMNFITELPELVSNTAVRLDSAEVSTEPSNSAASTSTCSNIASGHLSPLKTQTPSLLEPAPFNEIGTIFEPAKSVDIICHTVSGLSNDKKYSILYHHRSPPNQLPHTQHYCSNRKFNLTWLVGLFIAPSWMQYFVVPCSHLLPNTKWRDKGLIVNRPFSSWGKVCVVLNAHSSHRYHQ